MPIVSSGAVSLSDIQTEFGGSNPIGLSEYYQGGSIIGHGVYPNTIPTSGAIQFDDFYSAKASHHYYDNQSNRYTYSAATGWSIDYYNGKLRATVGWWANDPPNFGVVEGAYLQFGNSSGTDSTGRFFQNVHSVILEPNVTVDCNNSNFLRNNAFNANFASGGWSHRLTWNGANAITIQINPSWSGTGDTGTSITMSNMASSFSDKFGSTSFTFNFR
jgi:hypothetical protein